MGVATRNGFIVVMLLTAAAMFIIYGAFSTWYSYEFNILCYLGCDGRFEQSGVDTVGVFSFGDGYAVAALGLVAALSAWSSVTFPKSRSLWGVAIVLSGLVVTLIAGAAAFDSNAMVFGAGRMAGDPTTTLWGLAAAGCILAVLGALLVDTRDASSWSASLIYYIVPGREIRHR